MTAHQQPLKDDKPNDETQPQIVIANDLRSGLTVFLTESGEWSEQVDDALVVTDDDRASKALATAVRDESANKVTGSYLTDSNEQGAPLILRETLRVDGPSVDYLPRKDVTSPILSVGFRSREQISTGSVSNGSGQVQTTPLQGRRTVNVSI